MGEVLQGIMLWRKHHRDGSAHSTESKCLLQLKLTAFTGANICPLKYDRDVTVYSLPFRNTQEFPWNRREHLLTHTSTVSGHCSLSFQTVWQQDLIKQKLLHSYKDCKCEFKHAQITAEQSISKGCTRQTSEYFIYRLKPAPLVHSSQKKYVKVHRSKTHSPKHHAVYWKLKKLDPEISPLIHPTNSSASVQDDLSGQPG